MQSCCLANQMSLLQHLFSNCSSIQVSVCRQIGSHKFKLIPSSKNIRVVFWPFSYFRSIQIYVCRQICSHKFKFIPSSKTSGSSFNLFLMKLTENNSPEPLHPIFQHSRGDIFLKTFANLKILLSNLPTSFNSIKRRLQNSPLMFVVLSICNFCFPTFVRQTFLFPAHSLPLSSNKPKNQD